MEKPPIDGGRSGRRVPEGAAKRTIKPIFK
jgi:hypothetical protein